MQRMLGFSFRDCAAGATPAKPDDAPIAPARHFKRFRRDCMCVNLLSRLDDISIRHKDRRPRSAPSICAAKPEIRSRAIRGIGASCRYAVAIAVGCVAEERTSL